MLYTTITPWVFMGIDLSLNWIRLWFYWPKIIFQVRNCEKCKTSKAPCQTLRLFQRFNLIGLQPRSHVGNIDAIVVFHSLEVNVCTKESLFGILESITTTDGAHFRFGLQRIFEPMWHLLYIHSVVFPASQRRNRSLLATIRAYISPNLRADTKCHLSTVLFVQQSTLRIRLWKKHPPGVHMPFYDY